MSQLWKCPNGHTFKGPNTDDTVAEDTRCPNCGASSHPDDDASIPDDDVSLLDEIPSDATVDLEGHSLKREESLGTIALSSVEMADQPAARRPDDGTLDDAALDDDIIAAELLDETEGTLGAVPRPVDQTVDLDQLSKAEPTDMTMEHSASSPPTERGAGDMTADLTGYSGTAHLDAKGPTEQQRHDGGTVELGREAPQPTQKLTRKPKKSAPAVVSVPGYEILGVLGRGGMGVVYKAKHVALNRAVALKMILAGAHADDAQRTRFDIEARAIAQFQHPNIVQIYEVGESEGHPFFSLEYLDGGSLQQKLSGTPVPPRESARIMEILARAVHYAHEHGIVHRDLKPANILMTAEGSPKITDFGLAKTLDGSDSGNTGTEAVLGTPSYMAPEQAAGKTREVGPGADIYSLGAMLYDLLTGRPPFRGATLLDTLQQVQNAEPIAPSRLQQGIPIDLQTICLKCLEKDPARRYPDALGLAQDLQRFMEDRPIQARPTPMWERTWKWTKRRPAIAAMIGVSVFATLAIIGVLTVYTSLLQDRNVKLAEETDKAKTAKVAAEKAEKEAKDAEVAEKDAKIAALARKAEADEARGRAEKSEAEAVASEKVAVVEKEKAVKAEEEAQHNFSQAQLAVNKLVEVAQKKLLNQPRSEALRQSLLEQALSMQQYFLSTKSESEVAMHRTAQAYRMFGDIRENLGRSKEARENYDKAADLYRQLIDKTEDASKKDSLRLELANVLMNDWSVLEGSDPVAAKAALTKMQAQLQKLSTEGGSKAALYGAKLQNNLGIHFQRKKQLKEALAAFEEAEKLLLALPGDVASNQLELAKVETNRGAVLTAGLAENPERAAEDFDRAKKAYEAAIGRLEPLSKDPKNATDPSYARELGRVFANYGVLLRQQQKPYGDLYERAAGLFEKLAAHAPDVPDYRQLLAIANSSWGQHLLQERKIPEAQAKFQRSQKVLETLVADFPNVAGYQEELARCVNGIGLTNAASAQPGSAREPLEKALTLLDKLLAQTPANSDYARDRESVSHNLVAFYESEARRAEGSGAREQAKEHKTRAGVLRTKQATELLTQAERQTAARQYEAAAESLRKMRITAPSGWTKAPEGIQLLARCVKLAEDDGQLEPTRRDELTAAYAKQICIWLRDAARQNIPGLGSVLESAELRELQARPDCAKDLAAVKADLKRP